MRGIPKAAKLGNSSALNLNSLFQENLVTPNEPLGGLVHSGSRRRHPSVSFMCHKASQVPPGAVSLAREEKDCGADPPSKAGQAQLIVNLVLLNRFISSILEVSLWLFSLWRAFLVKRKAYP